MSLTDMRMRGDAALMRELERLPAAVQRRVMRPAVLKAGVPINKAAKALCPRRYGILRKSIGIKVKKYGSVIWGAVGVRTGFRQETPEGIEDPNKIAHLVEYGHGGPTPAPAHPFMRPAYDSQEEAAYARLRDEVEKGLHKAVMSR